MLFLPLDHPEPFAATLAVMLYPGLDEAEARKARAYAAQYLAGPIRQLHETGKVLSCEVLLRVATDAGERLDSLDARWWGGTAMGELIKTLFALANTDPKLSEVARARAIDWYSTTLVTRLNDKCSGSIIVVMQRLHEEDLAGHLLTQEGWAHLDLPAIAVEDQCIRLGPDPSDLHHRRAGDVLHPARESRETLQRIKADIGSLAFSAQYQQRPVPLEGNLVKREWFRTYDFPPTDAPNRQVVQSWDIATTVSTRSDFSVCTTWAKLEKNYYLLDVWRDRLEYPQLRRKVVAMQQTHGAQTVLIEEAGLGLNLYQDLCVDETPGFPRPIGIAPKGDKLTRMEAQTATIEAGQVFLPRDAGWLPEFLVELLAFPNGRHDDQVDSVSQFLGWTNTRRYPQIDIGEPIIVYVSLADKWRY